MTGSISYGSSNLDVQDQEPEAQVVEAQVVEAQVVEAQVVEAQVVEAQEQVGSVANYDQWLNELNKAAGDPTFAKSFGAGMPGRDKCKDFYDKGVNPYTAQKSIISSRQVTKL